MSCFPPVLWNTGIKRCKWRYFHLDSAYIGHEKFARALQRPKPVAEASSEAVLETTALAKVLSNGAIRPLTISRAPSPLVRTAKHSAIRESNVPRFLHHQLNVAQDLLAQRTSTTVPS
eukprot:gb/GECG01014766.1/.p1 GENE.gb/GECG01014766.1/~~gb/GECG01014766.1/.p1  ORF type:complete len:118 (+),score=10.54 gb/GECG01014766.1/:1-354(+)